MGPNPLILRDLTSPVLASRNDLVMGHCFHMARVDAFNMNDDAILTVKDDDGSLIASGVFRTEWLAPDRIEVDFGDAGKVVCSVTEIDTDPARLGMVAGQTRFRWSGTFKFDD